MRILLKTTIFTVLVLAASAASADTPLDQTSGSSLFQDQSNNWGGSGPTSLKMSTMYLEIKEILERTYASEQLLLKELAAATEDEEVERIIGRIERLEMDQTLNILKIQARYARLEGQWSLDYRLRVRIQEILAGEAYAVK